MFCRIAHCLHLCLLLHAISSSVCYAVSEAAALDKEIHELRLQLGKNPANALLQLQLATSLHRLNHLKPDGGRRVPEAEKAYRAALEAVGQHNTALYVNIQGNLGAVLLSGNQPGAAIAQLQQALDLAKSQKQPLHQHAGLLFNLGKALTTVGKLEEADKTYARAAAAAYGHDFASYSKAMAARQHMTQDEAIQAAQVAKAARQQFQQQQKLAFLEHLPTEDVVGNMQLQEQAWIEQNDSMELVWLHFAMFNHYHRNRQHDVAWQYLELGNKIMAALSPHNPNADLNNLRHIKDIFKAPMVSGGLNDRTPIFVVGMPRSGSTLVEQMLASHSEVFAAGEDTALAPLTKAINNQLSKPGVDHRRLLRKFGQKYIKLMRQRVPDDAHWPDPESGPKRIVDKMLRNLWLIGYIHMLVPESCIVHVARHPMDVALSCYSQPFGYSASTLSWAWDLDSIAQQLELSWELVDHWEHQLPGKVHTVLYEDLVAHPRAVAKELLAVCGLDWEEGVLQFQGTDRAVHTASMVQVRQPLYNSSVARWKVYEQHMAPLHEGMQPLINKYERLLQQYLEKRAAEDPHVESHVVPTPAVAAALQDSKAESSTGTAAAAAAAETSDKDEL